MLDWQNIPLHGAPICWFIAGGWALDLFLEKQTRDHADLDLGIFRQDQLALQNFLAGWTLSKVVKGESIAWENGEVLSLPVHEIHAKSSCGETIEVLLAEGDGTHWIYRRDPNITLPISSAIVTVADGVQVLAPEIVLLFKSKHLRTQDELDFENVRPYLAREQAQWLLDAIERTNALHPWSTKLAI
jgi:hypothetical protein